MSTTQQKPIVPSPSRFDELARHRKPPPVPSVAHCRWGDQSPLWPIKRETLQAEASERTEELAKTKQLKQPEHLQNRDLLERTSRGRMKLWRVADSALGYRCTERMENLAKPKDKVARSKEFNWRNSRTVSSSSPSLFSFTNSEETLRRLSAPLRRPKFEKVKSAERRLPVEIPIEALYFQPSKRLIALAKPKLRKSASCSQLFRDPEWRVSEDTLQRQCSQRLCQLALPKKLPPTYHMPDENERQHFLCRFSSANVIIK